MRFQDNHSLTLGICRFESRCSIRPECADRDPAETVDEEFPVWLTTGRRLASYHTRTQTGRASGIEYLLSEETLEVNPGDVAAWGLTDGGWARVTSPRGSLRIKVQATEQSPRGTVFASFSFADTRGGRWRPDGKSAPWSCPCAAPGAH